LTLSLPIFRFQVSDVRGKDTHFPFLISPKIWGDFQGNEQKIPFLSFLYSRNPLDSLGNVKVKLKIQPLDIVYNHDLVQQLVNMYQNQMNDPLAQTLQTVAAEQLEFIKTSTSKKIEAIIHHKEVLVKFLSLSSYIPYLCPLLVSYPLWAHGIIRSLIQSLISTPLGC